MTVRSHARGWPIECVGDEWVYEDNGQPMDEKRPCRRCGQSPTPEGHDACLGHIPGMTSACCGHGVSPAIRVMDGASFHVGDSLDILRSMATDSVDLVFCSPPYEAARTYGIGFNLAGDAWVEWALERYLECLRVCRGLVAWVVEGRTRNFTYSATPILLSAALHRSGAKLRKPPIYRRNGIPGSGGPDWLRNDYEFIVAATQNGRLPWSDNTACGHPPKCAAGGAPSHRKTDGTRANQNRRPDGTRDVRRYVPPKLSNPGNVIDCGAVGGGRMGSTLCHENEAPFPETLAEVFVKSFCPPGGIVLDPFCGSGTTCAMALRHGRDTIGIDIRESQIELTQRRIAEEMETHA